MGDVFEKVDYGAILADLNGKRAVLDAAIVSLEAALAAGAIGSPGEYIASQPTYQPFSDGNGHQPPNSCLKSSNPPWISYHVLQAALHSPA